MAALQDVVDSHPGLTFLQDAPEFHSRYVQTVCTFSLIFMLAYYVSRLLVLCSVFLARCNDLSTLKGRNSVMFMGTGI